MLGGLVVGALAQPLYYNVKAYMSMSKEEYIDYRNKYNTIVVERARNGEWWFAVPDIQFVSIHLLSHSGTNLYIPFFTRNIAVHQNEDTDRVFNETNLPPAQGHTPTRERYANMK